jgi:hypothetical protein
MIRSNIIVHPKLYLELDEVPELEDYDASLYNSKAPVRDGMAAVEESDFIIIPPCPPGDLQWSDHLGPV